MKNMMMVLIAMITMLTSNKILVLDDISELRALLNASTSYHRLDELTDLDNETESAEADVDGADEDDAVADDDAAADDVVSDDDGHYEDDAAAAAAAADDGEANNDADDHEEMDKDEQSRSEVQEGDHINSIPTKTDQSMLNGVEAIGFTNEDGHLWSVVCKNTPNGNIPCKLNGKGKAYYSWNGKEYAWTDISKPLPNNFIQFDKNIIAYCTVWGKQNDNDGKGVQDYYAGVIKTTHGDIPGKVDKTGTYAWYSYAGVETRVTKGFKVLC